MLLVQVPDAMLVDYIDCQHGVIWTLSNDRMHRTNFSIHTTEFKED